MVPKAAISRPIIFFGTEELSLLVLKKLVEIGRAHV